MWIRITLCVVLGGCGFRSQAAAGDAPGTSGPGSDAPGSDAGSGAATDCLQRWFDGAPGLAFSTPQEIIATPSNTDDRDPWVSADGLRLYFARNPGSHGKSDIYLTTRPSPADAFATLQAMDNLNTVDDEERPAPNSDETILIFSGNHMTGGAFQLFVSRRIATTDPFPSPSSPDQMLVATINAVPGGYFDPFLTRSGLKLYLALGPNGGPAQQIAVATRTSTDQNFPASVPVPVISSTSGDANPSVSADDRIIVFSSRRAPGVGGLGKANLWYATRQSPANDFGTPQLIPMVNSNEEDGDPVLSDDGCELYFASNRAASGKYHLFHAQMTK